MKIKHLPALGGEIVSCTADNCIARTYRPSATNSPYRLEALFAIEMRVVRLILCREHLVEMYAEIVRALADVPTALLAQCSDAELALIHENHDRYAPSPNAPDDEGTEAWRQYDRALREEIDRRSAARFRREGMAALQSEFLASATSSRGSIHEGCGGTWEAPPDEASLGVKGLIDRCSKCGEERA